MIVAGAGSYQLSTISSVIVSSHSIVIAYPPPLTAVTNASIAIGSVFLRSTVLMSDSLSAAMVRDPAPAWQAPRITRSVRA